MNTQQSQEHKKITSKRKVSIKKSLLIALSLCAVIPQSAQAITLKSYSELHDNVIRLSDIFSDLPKGLEATLGTAPAPGKSMTLRARTLLRVALSQSLDWRPQGVQDQITLHRIASVIDTKTTESALKAAIKDNGVNGDFNINVPQHMTEIVLPANTEKTVEIGNISINPENDQFQATLYAPSKNNVKISRQISGTIDQMVKIPSLKSTITQNDIIRESDIEYINISKRNLNQDTVIKAQDLIGMTPRRFLNANEAINKNSLIKPQIVSRGEYITLTFNHGTLRLTARGKALENGAKGDIIRVVNTSSNQTVDATVIASKEVHVQRY